MFPNIMFTNSKSDFTLYLGKPRPLGSHLTFLRYKILSFLLRYILYIKPAIRLITHPHPCLTPRVHLRVSSYHSLTPDAHRKKRNFFEGYNHAYIYVPSFKKY